MKFNFKKNTGKSILFDEYPDNPHDLPSSWTLPKIDKVLEKMFLITIINRAERSDSRPNALYDIIATELNIV